MIEDVAGDQGQIADWLDSAVAWLDKEIAEAREAAAEDPENDGRTLTLVVLAEEVENLRSGLARLAMLHRVPANDDKADT